MVAQIHRADWPRDQAQLQCFLSLGLRVSGFRVLLFRFGGLGLRIRVEGKVTWKMKWLLGP